MLGKAEFVGHSSTHVERPSKMPTWTQDLPFRAKRLFAATIAKSDDQLRAAALANVKQVLLFEPSDSALGLSLLEAGGGLVSILEDTFVKKATNTVAKRATDFYKFAVWQVCENHARPLHPCEGDLYKYMCRVRDSGAAPTAPTSFLAAWRFMIYSVGVKLPNAPLTISASKSWYSPAPSCRPVWPGSCYSVCSVRQGLVTLQRQQDCRWTSLAGFS